MVVLVLCCGGAGGECPHGCPCRGQPPADTRTYGVQGNAHDHTQSDIQTGQADNHPARLPSFPPPIPTRCDSSLLLCLTLPCLVCCCGRCLVWRRRCRTCWRPRHGSPRRSKPAPWRRERPSYAKRRRACYQRSDSAQKPDQCQGGRRRKKGCSCPSLALRILREDVWSLCREGGWGGGGGGGRGG